MARSSMVQVGVAPRLGASPAPLYTRYRFIALATYGMVLLAGLADASFGGIGPNSLVAAPEGVRFVIFLSALVGLIWTEVAALGSAGFRPSGRAGALQLVLRLGLFTAIFAFGDPIYSQVLFLVLILYLYLGVGKRVSYAVAVLGFGTLLALGGANPPVLAAPAPPPPAAGGAPPPLASGRLIDHGFSLVAVLFFDFLLARAMARAADDQERLEALHGSLERSHEQLRASTDRVAELAATEERNRLARDIHDSLGHHLAAISIQLAKARAYRDRDPVQATTAIDHAQRSVRDALGDVRGSVGSLRRGGEAFSLDDSLDDLVERMRHGDLDIQLIRTGDGGAYGNLAQTTLYRVVQEALTNVHKHAAARRATIEIDCSPERARLVVTDDGSGFDVAAWEQRRDPSNGLRGLRERLHLVGGTLHLHSEPGRTVLTATLDRAADG